MEEHLRLAVHMGHEIGRLRSSELLYPSEGASSRIDTTFDSMQA